MPFRILQYFITDILCSVKNEFLSPHYRIDRTTHGLAIARQVCFAFFFCLALFPTAQVAFLWLYGKNADLYCIVALLLWSLAVGIYRLGFFRGAFISALVTGAGYLLLSLIHVLYRASSGKIGLFWFFLFDLFLLIVLLAATVIRIYKRRNFYLLFDLDRNGNRWAINLNPPTFLMAPYTEPPTLYTVEIHLSDRDDPFAFRTKMAYDLYRLLIKNNGHLLACSLRPETDQFFFYFYAPSSPYFQKKLKRFLHSHAKDVSLKSEPDADLLYLDAVLPTQKELFHIYTDLLLSTVDLRYRSVKLPLPISFYLAFPDREHALDFLSLAEGEGFRFVELEGTEDIKEGTASTEEWLTSFGNTAKNGKEVDAAKGEDRPLTLSDAADEAFRTLSSFSAFLTVQKDVFFQIDAINRETDFLVDTAVKLGGQLAVWRLFQEEEAPFENDTPDNGESAPN